MIPDCPIGVDAQAACRGDCIDIGPEEEKLPAVPHLLALDHLTNLPDVVPAAGVLQAVCCDDEERVRRHMLRPGAVMEMPDVADCSADGIQLLENETVTLVYLDYDGGSVFDNFILTYSGGTDTVENNYLLTMTRDVTVSAQSHLDLYYEVNIPETVALDDAGTSEKISVSTLKNLEADEVLSVSVTGTDEQGRATLIRKNTDDVLYVPVTNSSNLPFVPNTILLQYKLDENHKPVLSYGDGKVNFGAPQGTKKAGEYAGSITFSITCEEEKGNP